MATKVSVSIPPAADPIRNGLESSGKLSDFVLVDLPNHNDHFSIRRSPLVARKAKSASPRIVKKLFHVAESEHLQRSSYSSMATTSSTSEASANDSCSNIATSELYLPGSMMVDISPIMMRRGEKGGIHKSLGASAVVVPVDMNCDDVDSVFQDERARAKNEEEIERKLVDWAINVYVPACKSLLQHCAAKKVVPSKVQADLRHLANTVTFFCNEHQERSNVSHRGLSPSKSIGEIPDAVSNEESSQYQSPNHPESDSSVAVKVLRSVSTSLLHPLLGEAAGGFSSELYKDIVSAIQKISWKVEACLTSVDEDFSIHREIFDPHQTLIVGTMMTALPPEEPKIHSSPAHVVRKSSLRGKHRMEISYVPVTEHEPVTPSPLQSQSYSLDVADRPKSTDPRYSTEEMVLEDACCSVPTSPLHSDLVESNYFHPRSSRRQTISLSKRQVKSLGLNMIRSTEASELVAPRSNTIGMGSHLAIQQEDSNLDLQEIRDKVRLKLAKEGLGHLEDMSQDLPLDVDVSPCKEGERTAPERPLTLMSVSSNTSDMTSPVESSQTPTSPLYYREHPQPAGDYNSRFSCDPNLMGVSSSTPRRKKKSGLRYRAPSLDLDLALSTTSDAPKSPSALSHHGSFYSPSPSNSSITSTSTLPHKKKNFVSKLRKKASKSFGRGDSTLTRKGMKMRNSEFFSAEESRREGSVFQDTSTLESFSTKVTIPNKLARETCLLNINVEVASKTAKTVKSPGGKRKPSISAGSLSSATLEISVSTNMPELHQQEYKILRTFKEVLVLYDKMKQTYSSVADFPDRPEKKIIHRKERQQAEDFLRHVACVPALRMSVEFLQFMQPEGLTFSRQDSEVEHLMTFYTPTSYPRGVAGSHHIVEVISKDLPTPTSPNRKLSYPSVSKKSSSKWATRKEGNEEQSTFIIREEGHDVLMIAEEEDKFLVVAGTFEKLVEQLACEERPDARYVSTLLLGYRHFSTSEDLLSALIRRFQMTVAPNASEQELAYAEKWRYLIQLRVLDVIGYWMKNCWADFHRNPQTLARLKEFIASLRETDDSNFHTASISMKKTVEEKLIKFKRQGFPSPSRKTSTPSIHTPTSSISPTSPTRSSNSRSPVHSPTPSPHFLVSNSHSPTPTADIHTFTAIQIARQLTLIELKFLKVMDIYELAVYAWESSSPENKPYRRNLDAYITRFNTVSYWVASEICSIQDVKTRAVIIEKFIEVAKHCLEYKNFNTTISVVTGLALSAIRRLKKTWEHVSEKMVKSFHKLQHLTYPSSNHSDYRKALATLSRRDGCIPYFGVFMRDVTLFNEGNAKKLKNGLINFSKLRTLITMFEELKQFQHSRYYFPPEDRCMAFCSDLHCMTEQVLYDTSELREPRERSPAEETT